jgi:hypothetical protein
MTLPYFGGGGEIHGLVSDPHVNSLFAQDAFVKTTDQTGADAEQSQRPKQLPRDLYDQLIIDTDKIRDAGFPRLAQLALEGDGIRLGIDADGK